MLTLLRTLSLGYFARHLTRCVLVVLSIALGVATFVATQSLRKSLAGGVQEGVNPLAPLAELIVVKGQTGVPMDLAEKIRAANLDGVRDAQPQVMWRVAIKELNNQMAWLLGVDFKHTGKGGVGLGGDNELGVKVLDVWKPGVLELPGLFVAQPGLVSKKLADALHSAQGDERVFTLRNAGFMPQVTRVATLDFAVSKLPLKESFVLVMDVRSASAICFPEKPDHVHQIGVTLKPGADVIAVSKELTRFLDGAADVQTLEISRNLVSDVTSGLEVGIGIGGAVALVVGLFLVYNILSVSVTERRHDIGILRSVGATRGQIAGLFVGEATALGLVGSLLGLPIGWALAWLACRPMASTISDVLVPIDSVRLWLPWWFMLAAVLSGTTVAVFASLVPALQAASEEPADAVRRVPRRNLLLLAVIQIVAMAAFILIGLGFAQNRHLLPRNVGMFGGIMCLFLGGLIATPVLAALFGRALKPLFRHVFGLEGRLAADNLVRSPGRTGLVIGALAATVGLLASTAGFVKSTRLAIRDWIEEKIAADLFVTSGSSLTSAGAALQMREEMRAKLQALPGVEAALPLRFQRLDYRSPHDGQWRIVFLVALDTQTFRNTAVSGPLAQSMDRYSKLGFGEPGTVVVSENFAALHRVKVGDSITFPGGQAPITAKVVGLVTDYTWSRGTILMDMAWFRQEYRDQQVDVFDLFLAPGHDAEEVRSELMRRHGNEDVLFAVTRPEVHAEVSSMFNKIYGLAYAQQTVVGVVALLGVVSALIISVLQRQRELGLLRAVGATRGQILRSVLAEAVLMGVIGVVVGFGVGLLLEWYILDVLILDESGFRFPLRIPWVEAGVVAAVAVALATLAGLWPAYQATRLRIPEAIAYE